MKWSCNEGECSFETGSAEETEEAGQVVGSQLVPGDVVALTGELGSGKTCFTRGIARGLKIERSVPVVSPSFTIINEYPGPIPLYHFDLYRIEHHAQVLDLGYEEYFFGKGVAVIEWGERARQLLPEGHILVTFTFLGNTTRRISIKAPEEMVHHLVTTIEKRRFPRDESIT